MRTLAPIWIGFCLVAPIAMAKSPGALQLPPTLQLSDSGVAELDDLATELEDSPSQRHTGPLQLKDFIIRLESVAADRENPDLKLPASGEQPFSREGLGVIATEASRRSAELATTVCEVMPVGYGDASGAEIHARASVQYGGIELGLNGNDDVGPADRLDDKKAFDTGYFNDIDATESRTRSALGHFRELEKPLSTIKIELGSQGKVSPANLAQDLVGQKASILITASGASIPLPDRYTIGFAHRPLYYEELDLERCGLQHGCLQYEVSGFYFLLNTFMLSYRMATQCPGDLVCTPGDCRSCQSYACEIEPLGLNKRAIIAETAALAGFTFLLL